MYRERTNVSAREKQWLHHERIRGDRYALAPDGYYRLVVQLGQSRVAERRKENLVDQFRAEPAAAAVPEQHCVLRGKRRGATEFHDRLDERRHYFPNRPSRGD